MNYKIALIGFGNVGQGFAKIILDKGDWIKQTFGVGLQVVAICDQSGSIYDPDGIELSEVFTMMQSGKHFADAKAAIKDWDVIKVIEESNANIVAEMTYTNLETGEPAVTYIRHALKSQKHVISPNKGPAALHYKELKMLAAVNKVELGMEGTVMSGTPAVHVGMDLLKAAEIKEVQGILNGTTNYILSQMHLGKSYEDALKEAQELGYAEADPTGDVEGFDAAGKVSILAGLLMNASVGMNDIDRTGISHLTVKDIKDAEAAGETWKLIGKIESNGKVKASVKPMRLPNAHPLASVNGASNAITYSTDLLGDVTLIGPGAGRIETGYSLLVDLICIHQKMSQAL